MRIYLEFVFIVAICLLCQKCSAPITVRDKSELIKYINNTDNGLKRMTQIGNIDISFTFHPSELMVSSELNVAHTLNLSDKYYFVLGMSSHNKELLKQLQFSQYSKIVQLLAFRMKKYVSLISEEGEAVEPIDCLFQQTYGSSNENEVLLLFAKKNFEKVKHIKFSIREFGLDTGDLIFEFNTVDIKNTPIIRP